MFVGTSSLVVWPTTKALVSAVSDCEIRVLFVPVSELVLKCEGFQAATTVSLEPRQVHGLTKEGEQSTLCLDSD